MLDALPASGLTNNCIEKALESYQKARKPRAKAFTQISGGLARRETYETSRAKFMMAWISPHLRDSSASEYGTCLANNVLINILDAMSNLLSKGPRIDYLPLPKARLQGNYQWALPDEVKKDTMLRRALVSSPLLLVSYGAIETIGVTVAQMLPLLRKASQTSLLELGDGGSSVQMPVRIYGNNMVNGLVKALVAFFLPSLAGSDPIGRLQAIAFLSDFSVVITISVIESIRTGNAYTFASA